MSAFIPLAVTFLAAAGADALTYRPPKYPSLADGIMRLVIWLVAIIIALAAWLIWALTGGTQ